MQNEFMKSFEQLGKQAMEAAKEVVYHNNAFLNQVLESQVEMANLYVEGG